MNQTFTPDFYESIVKNSADVIAVIDKAGVYTYVSDAAEEVLGYSADELLGKDCLMLVHQEDVAALTTAMQSLPEHDSKMLAPYRVKIRNGGWKWIECRATNMLGNSNVNGFVANYRDITQSIAAKPAENTQNAFYHSLFYNHPDSVFTLDSTGRFLKINATIGRTSGFSEVELQGAHFMSLVKPESYTIATESFSKALAGEPHTAEVAIVTKQGTKAMLCVTIVPVLVNGTIAGIQGIAKDITKEKEAELLIRKQAEQLSNIVESIADPFFVLDNEWRYVYVNSAFAAYLRKDTAEFEKQNVWQFTPELSNSLFYQNCQKVATTNQPLHFDETFTCFGNISTTFSISVFPFPGGVSVFFRDITFEKDLQSEFEKLSMVVSKTTNGIIILNNERRIEWINSGFTKLTGYSLVESLQEKPHVILRGPDTDKATANRIEENFGQNIPFSEEVLNYRKSGEEIWLKINIIPILNEQRQVSKFIGILTDITEKKKSEHRLLQLATDLYRHNRDLQQFTYIVSHNLRAPVANAVGLSNLMNKVHKDTPVFDEALVKLKTSLTKLDNVISDLNSILTIRDSAHTAVKEMVDIHQVSRQVISDLQDKFTACNATISLKIEPDNMVYTNNAFLYNIFYSLLINALKFRSDTRLLKVSIKCRRFGSNNTAISITDNGSGMDMNKIKDHIFTLYTRFHYQTEGKGIGLFLVKAQVEALGGKIKVKSKLNVGTTFTIFL